jgi:tRNA-Thr(GGU) m(6)t(6)A37 methyltransferase TsaA
MGQDHELKVHPIGRVTSGRNSAACDDRWEEVAAEIEINAAWIGALDGIEEFSHIWVVWWLDRFEGPPDSTHVRAERREDMPLVGILATRSPHRPNPIALTVVRLLAHEGNLLRVQGLDAYEGTPILDIKPYLRRGDLIPEATVPGWLEELWRSHVKEV